MQYWKLGLSLQPSHLPRGPDDIRQEPYPFGKLGKNWSEHALLC